MFRNSKMPFGSGFVFSRIHTTELIFNQLLLSLDRSLKLIWIVSVTRNFSLTLQRLWCTKFQLGSNAFVFPSTGHSVDIQDFFFLLQDCYKLYVSCFFFLAKGARSDVRQEKSLRLYVQLFYCSRTDLFFLHVCHNQQVNLL